MRITRPCWSSSPCRANRNRGRNSPLMRETMSATKSPPGPPGRFLSGNLREFRRDMLGFYTRCAREYGDRVAIRLGPRSIYLVNHPDLVEDVLVRHGRNFRKHFALRMNRLLLGNGLLTSEGDFWLRQRR